MGTFMVVNEFLQNKQEVIGLNNIVWLWTEYCPIEQNVYENFIAFCSISFSILDFTDEHF